jgi:septum formation protein
MNIEDIFREQYILASKSDRRKTLLRQLGIRFSVIESNAVEVELNYGSPVKLVRHNSKIKAEAVAEKVKDKIIIAADTVVYLDGFVFHKPKDEREAVKYLRTLSGRVHTVYTGLCIINTRNGEVISDYEKTKVYFRDLSDKEIRYYVKNYKPLDKAGAYGIQEDFGCLFIEKISGDYYNVVGLPLTKLYNNLLKLKNK